MKKGIVIFCIAIVAHVIAIFNGGWALTVLWDWFIIPVFELPSLNILSAAGIMLVSGFLTKSIDRDEGEALDMACHTLAIAIVIPPIAVLSGLIITFFM